MKNEKAKPVILSECEGSYAFVVIGETGLCEL